MSIFSSARLLFSGCLFHLHLLKLWFILGQESMAPWLITWYCFRDSPRHRFHCIHASLKKTYSKQQQIWSRSGEIWEYKLQDYSFEIQYWNVESVLRVSGRAELFVFPGPDFSLYFCFTSKQAHPRNANHSLPAPYLGFIRAGLTLFLYCLTSAVFGEFFFPPTLEVHKRDCLKARIQHPIWTAILILRRNSKDSSRSQGPSENCFLCISLYLVWPWDSCSLTTTYRLWVPR